MTYLSKAAEAKKNPPPVIVKSGAQAVGYGTEEIPWTGEGIPLVLSEMEGVDPSLLWDWGGNSPGSVRDGGEWTPVYCGTGEGIPLVLSEMGRVDPSLLWDWGRNSPGSVWDGESRPQFTVGLGKEFPWFCLRWGRVDPSLLWDWGRNSPGSVWDGGE